MGHLTSFKANFKKEFLDDVKRKKGKMSQNFTPI